MGEMRYVRCSYQQWSFLLEVDTGFVREVCYGGERLAIAIYSAVRGVDWSTLPVRLSELHSGESWCRWRTQAEGAPFAWTTEVVADAAGFRVTIDGVAAESFQTCRTGLCLLHPLSVCGAEVTVTHVDGSQERSAFPELVAPHQPFMEIAGLNYRLSSGVAVDISFAGEVFETEDQRNWSDASFKTYCHRLADGKPYTIEKRRRVWQEIRVRCTGSAQRTTSPPAFDAAMPEWSVWLDVMTPAAVRNLQQVGCHRLATDRVEVLPAASELGMAVDLRLAAQQLLTCAPVPAPAEGSTLWLVSDRWSEEAQEAYRRMADDWLPLGWGLGYGSSTNFAELNRSRPPEGAFRWLGTAASPQVHTFDAWSILQNAESFADIGRTMRAFENGAALMAGPIRFESRFSGSDPRSDSTLAAAYLLLAIPSAAQGGFRRLIAGTASQMTHGASPVGEVMRELFGIRPNTVRALTREGVTVVRITGAKGSVAYEVNPAPEEHAGIEPFSLRRQLSA
jgi:hypothetical protein